MKKIILASKSPRRKELLEQIGLKFVVDISDVDESKLANAAGPSQLAKSLSKAKAEKVSKKYKDAIIIAADTLVVLGKEIIGKPKDKKDAFKMLKKLSSKTHVVITGFTLLSSKSKKAITKTVQSKVKFKKMSDIEIRNYVETGEPMDKAGGYGIQNKGAIFIEKVEGDFFNVVGLPVYCLCCELKKFGINITGSW
jgi:septum formation protein